MMVHFERFSEKSMFICQALAAAKRWSDAISTLSRAKELEEVAPLAATALLEAKAQVREAVEVEGEGVKGGDGERK